MSLFNLSAKYSKPFRFISWPNFHEEYHILSLISGVKLLLIGLRNALIDSYIFSILYKLILFPLTLQFTEWVTHLIFCVPDVKNKKSLNCQPYFMFYCKLSKINLDFISELINLKYAFNIPFKVTLKTIITETSSQFHDGVQLNILPTLGSEILLLNCAQKNPL